MEKETSYIKLIIVDSEYPERNDVLEEFILVNPNREKITELDKLMHGENTDENEAFDIFENIYEFIEDNFDVITDANVKENIVLYW